jgi:DNA-binding transcriptional LysR family regulator
MELKILRSFVAVATNKSFSAAARELNTVQPAISRQIAALENELGVRLLLRNTREVKLTNAGSSLLHDAQAILADEAAAREQVRRAAQGKTGRLRIGYLGPACFTFIPLLVQAYTARYPEVEIQLRDMTVRQQLDAFDAEQMDIGFSRALPRSYQKDFTVEEIYLDTLIAVLPETHPLAAAKSLRLSQLEAESFILYSRHEAAGLFDQVISVFQQSQIAPTISSQPEKMQVLLTEVAAGLGVSVVPACIRNMYTVGCSFIPIFGQTPSIATQLHCRAGFLSPTVASFIQIAKENKMKIRQQMEL